MSDFPDVDFNTDDFNADFEDFTADPSQTPVAVPPDFESGSGTTEVLTFNLGGNLIELSTHEWGQLSDGSSYAIVDVDENGRADSMVLDTDGDGVVDSAIVRLEDGSFLLGIDGDGNGSFESELPLSEAELQAAAPDAYDIMVAHDVELIPGEADPGADPGVDPAADPGVVYPEVDEGRIIGDPFAYGDDWFYQSFDGSCLPAALAQIYSEYMGVQVGDEAFVQIANELGAWIVDSEGGPGIAPGSAAEMLNAAGIPAEYLTDQTINDLAGYLSAPPHAVMVAVDADVYWSGEPADGINHAVLLTGIDPVNGVVYLSDTGTPDGNMIEVDIEAFLEAWGVGGNQLVVTELSVAEFQDAQFADPAVEPMPADALPSDAAPDLEAAPPVDPALDPAGAMAGSDTAPLRGEGTVPELNLEGATLTSQGPIGQATDWVRTHPWVLVPVVIGAGAVIAGALQKRG